jgi:5-methylcytosine-specific restriction endonuclease McrA
MEKIERVKRLVSTKGRGTLDFEGLFGLLMDDYLDRHSPEGRQKRKEEREKWAQRAGREGKKSLSGTQAKSQEMDQGLRSAGTGQSGSSRRSHCPPTHTSNSKRSRYIPQSVRDEVYLRDGGRCSFVAPDRRRCEKKRNLEIDHIVPFARGGANTADNLRLLCPRHNMHAAEREFGREHMKRYRKQG